MPIRQDARPAAEDDECDWAKPDPDWERVQKALGTIKNACDHDNWLTLGMALNMYPVGQGTMQPKAPASGAPRCKRWPDKYPDKARRSTWKSCKRTGTGIGSLFQIAKKCGRTGKAETAATKTSRLTFLSPADCEAALSRGYVVKGLICPR